MLAILGMPAKAEAKNNLFTDLTTLATEKEATDSHINELDKQILEKEEQLKLLEIELPLLESKIVETNKRLEEQRIVLEKAKDKLRNAAINAYIGNGSEKPSTIKIMEDASVLSTYMEKKKYEEIARDNLSNTRKEAAQLEKSISEEARTVEEDKERLVTLKETLAKEKEDLLTQYQEQVAQQEKAEAEIRVLINQLLASGIMPEFTGSTLGLPVDAPVLTSGFGYRMHPVLHTELLHSGVDFGVGIGTPLKASEKGKVVIAGVAGGYGNYTCIAHGSGLSTCYAHQSQLLVTVGQDVERGQIIGLSGNTGRSTGPHLHYEVRLNGVAVDPMPYLGL